MKILIYGVLTLISCKQIFFIIPIKHIIINKKYLQDIQKKKLGLK